MKMTHELELQFVIINLLNKPNHESICSAVNIINF
jgi:tetrahydromethanopterin S-methyltransferase subunit F